MVSGGKWHDTDFLGLFYAICMKPKPSNAPSLSPSSSPTGQPTSLMPTSIPSIMPTSAPTVPPTHSPTFAPTREVQDQRQSSNFSISLGSSEFVILVLVIALISTTCFIFGVLCSKVLVRKNKRREEMVSTIEGAL